MPFPNVSVIQVLSNPEPRADQVEPFHRAMRFAETPPAVVKLPPAYKFPLPSKAIALHASVPVTVPANPVPRADHPEPFQRAIRFAVIPPAVVKKPPAYKNPSGPTANA